jgi:hypothetical protein
MKTYKINEAEFTLKPHGKLTLRESEKIREIIEGFKGEGNVLISKFTNNQINTFLRAVLEPVNEHIEHINVDFMDCTNETALEIIKDFFLDRLSLMNTTMEPLEI